MKPGERVPQVITTNLFPLPEAPVLKRTMDRTWGYPNQNWKDERGVDDEAVVWRSPREARGGRKQPLHLSSPLDRGEGAEGGDRQERKCQVSCTSKGERKKTKLFLSVQPLEETPYF